jgi:TM2 domain-containing membrane protein YozV
MNNGNGLASLVCLVVPAILIAAMVFLVRKTREEEAKTKDEVQQIISSLPRESQSAFLVQYNAQSKNPTTAIILALFLGGLGIHKFYLGQTGLGIVYLLFFWTFIPAFIAFIEAFTISQSIHKMNRQVAQETAALLGGGRLVFAAAPAPPSISAP